jgi:hypothetical protein
MCVKLISNEQSSLVSKPTNCSFDLPSVPISPQRSTILSGRLLAPFPMRGDLFDAPPLEGISNPVGVGCLVINQSTGSFLPDSDINQRLNRADFGCLSRRCECRDGNSLSIRHQHELCSFSFLGLTNLSTPFFAGEKVPSPIACDQSSSFRRSMSLTSLSQAWTSNPASVHSLCRRQQVAKEGYRSGKSCHRAPVFNTQRTPSIHCRESTRGRPPSGEGSGGSNKSLIRFHWTSVTKGFGAVLDPVVFGRRLRGHIDRVTCMRGSPFSLSSMQIACHRIYYKFGF